MQTGESLVVFLRNGKAVLSDEYQEIESTSFYADGRNHDIEFKKFQNGYVYNIL